jgi:hypothetical protein
MKTKILLFTTALFLSGMIRGQIIHVPGDQATIQDGINFASNGDTVLVADSTYYENIRFFGKAITVASEFIMDDDTSHISNTIINGSQPINPDHGAVVIFMNGEDTTSILNGFTITGGTGLEIAGQRMGGGISCYQCGTKILNNKIINNEISYAGLIAGGGISSYIDNGEAWTVIENNIICGNSCTSDVQSIGGGIAVGSHARIVNNSIYNNHCEAPALNALTEGGGLFIESFALLDSVFVKSNEIFDNTLESEYCRGAGIYVSMSFLDLCNNTINNNSTTGTYCNGSAIRLNNIDGEINIENNLIYENKHQSENVGLATIYLNSVQNVDSKVTIKNNSIYNNLATGTGTNFWGTAIWLRDLGDFLVVIDGNIIKGHEGRSGSGIWSSSSFNYRLTNNVFKANTVGEYGGAINNRIDSKDKDDIYFFPGQPKPKPVNFKNKGSFRPLIANNTFVGNHAGIYGGAVYLSTTCDSLCPVFINNIFKDNTADGLDFDVHHNGDEELLFSNNNIDLSRISGNWAGTGNIAGDPGFIDTLFHIDEYSLCCGAGIDSVFHDEKWYSSPMTDYEGDLRPWPFMLMPDMGVDEIDEINPGYPEFRETNNHSLILKNYPNPFRNQTTIELNITQSGFVKLSIVDFTGKEIQCLISENLSDGTHLFEWNAERLPAGIYFLRLEMNGIAETRKLLLIK